MRRGRWPGLVWWCLVLIGASACDSGPRSVRTVDDLAGALTEAFCAWQFRCCTPLEINTLEGARYTTEAACVESGIAVSVREQLGFAGAAVADGTMEIDAQEAAACVDAYRARACMPAGFVSFGSDARSSLVKPDISSIVAVCPGLFVGQVPPGERCGQSVECAPGSRCVKPPSGTVDRLGNVVAPTGDGACVPYLGLGDPCDSSESCDPAANRYCRTTEFVCAERGREGDPCFPDLGGEVLCGLDLYCDTEALVCRRLPGTDQACRPFSTPSCDPDPALGLQCVGMGFNGSGICTPPGKKDEACGGSALPTCAAGLVCRPMQADAIGVCDEPPGPGEPCASNGSCGGGAACDYLTSTCTTPGDKQALEECEDNAECASLTCREFVARKLCAPSTEPVACSGNQVTPGNGTGVGPRFDGGTFFDAAFPLFDASVGPGFHDGSGVAEVGVADAGVADAGVVE